MNFCVRQLVALSCHLQGALRSGRADPFFPENPSCAFCESITFSRRLPRLLTLGVPIWSRVSRTPDEWFARAVEKRFEKAVIRHESTDSPQFPDRISSAFVGGGGLWSLQLQRGNKTEHWFANWHAAPDNRNPREDRRIWRVVYRAFRRQRYDPPAEDLSQLAAELSTILSVMEGFATLHDLPPFARCFREAQECLAADLPIESKYLKGLAPDGLLNSSSRRLMAAAQAAWVFGGMGSWNDLGFMGADRLEYDAFSQRLFDLINRTICAATNASQQ
ncbi:MAG TPA: hypothetical protein VEI07_09500 [Planctomycetaceae bacterium]|nr:hypothetical protein [Planctomycetaceae bacterium]